MKPLEATTNSFSGILPDPAGLDPDPERFRDQLEHSLAEWRAEGYRVVWLEIPINRSALIPVAVGAGFVFHHSGEDYLMLTCRLDERAFVPQHASHYIGAGGVVFNGGGELLVVTEKHHRRPDRAPYYKLPGGALRQGEHLVSGVIREVFEETGIQTEFRGLICFRHWHGYRFGKSDIYFICRLRPLSHEICKCEEEIDECLWMPVEEYLACESVSVFNKTIVRAALQAPGLEPTWVEGYADPERYEFFMPGLNGKT